MEIERKFLIKKLPKNLEQYPCRMIEQAYLNVRPVVRIRRDQDAYYLTYKGSGMIAREEYNLPLDENSYRHLLKKADGNIITKKRYEIPFMQWTIELDQFEGLFEGVMLAEVEFSSLEEAEHFIRPDWFGEDVSLDRRYHNSYMSCLEPEKIRLEYKKDESEK